MSAIPEEFVRKTTELSEDVTQPFPGSRKIYVEGSRPDLRVGMREITQADTPASFGAETNPPITVYDTSGPYTDPQVSINLLQGLPDVRGHWIDERNDTEWLDAVDFINSKNNFMALADELGVDVPETLCFDSIEAIDADTIRQISYPCYLKAAISVSGVGIYRCEDEFEFREALTKFDENVPVQVQEEVTTEIFLNMQYKVEGNQLIRLATSEQILDGMSIRVIVCRPVMNRGKPSNPWLTG